MFLCAWRLPSFPPRGVPSRGSTNQNVAGHVYLVYEVLYDGCRSVAYTVKMRLNAPEKCPLSRLPRGVDGRDHHFFFLPPQASVLQTTDLLEVYNGNDNKCQVELYHPDTPSITLYTFPSQSILPSTATNKARSEPSSDVCAQQHNKPRGAERARPAGSRRAWP